MLVPSEQQKTISWSTKRRYQANRIRRFCLAEFVQCRVRPPLMRYLQSDKASILTLSTTPTVLYTQQLLNSN